jgi:hypothetical protein
MNALIIVTTALSGPMYSDVNLLDLSEVPSAAAARNQVALGAFQGPMTALAMGSGDVLGYELYAMELVVSTRKHSSLANAD